MNDMNTPIMSPPTPSGPAGWFQIWMKAFTKPSEQTFVDISESPDVKIQTALIWAAIAGLITGLGAGIGSAFSGLLTQGGGDSGAMGMIVGFICGLPIGFAIITPISLAISSALFQWIAKLFGGVGSFEKLLYSLAAIIAPLSFISGALSLLSGIPIVGVCVSIFSSILSIYGLVLNIMAVKAVNKFDWGRAAGSVLIPAIVIGVFCACVLIIGLAALGPVIGDTFNELNQGLQSVP